ncbi:MAG: hypothetical protein B6U76_03610 [Desulfurococcales archaeon ex4484_217_2]|nr:MAG: hypothetical protein B6U76_03610 [Desulfurococcales archaeon ex4484_217_2]
MMLNLGYGKRMPIRKVASFAVVMFVLSIYAVLFSLATSMLVSSPMLYVVIVFFQLILTTLLESPTLALISSLMVILGINVLKRYVLLLASLLGSPALYYLVFAVDTLVKNASTYLVILATYVTLYYSWTFIAKKGDYLIEKIKEKEIKKPKINVKYVALALLISLTIMLIRPMTLLDEIIYFVGVLTSILIIGTHRYSILATPILSWITTPLLYTFREETVVVELKKPLTREGIVLGKVAATLTHGKPVNEWLKDKITAKSPSWYWRKVSGDYAFDPYHQVNYHILITGTSGTGKSSLARKLVKELYYKWRIPSLILDPHNEYISLVKELGGVVVDASEISVNPLELDGASPRERAVQVADTLQRVFRLGNLQRAILEDLIEEAYAEKGILLDDEETWNNTPPTFQTLLKVVEKKIEYAESSAERSRYESLKPYLRMLASTIFRNTTIEFSEILSKPSVIAMAKLPGDYVKSILSETILRKIAHKMYLTGKKNTLNNYVVIDEAHRLYRRGVEPSLVAKLMMESRKFGIGFIIITQQPLDIDESIIANAATKISFKITEPENLDYIAKAFAGFVTDNRYDMVRKAIYYLPNYYAVIKDSTLSDPVIVKVDTLS